MEDNKQVHINIYKPNKEAIEKASNMSEAYIILANEDLNNKIRDLIAEIKEVSSQVDTLTEDNERMEVTLGNQRSLLHNFNELNKKEKEVTKTIEALNETYKNHVKELEDNIEQRFDRSQKNLSYFLIALLIQSCFGLITPGVLILILVNIGSVIYICMKLNSIDSDPKSIFKTMSALRNSLEVKLNNLKLEMKEVSQSCDHISDYIDSI